MSNESPPQVPALWAAASVLDALEEAVIAIDTQYHVRAWNAAAMRLFGWGVNEITAQLVSYQIAINLHYETRFKIIKQVSAGGTWCGQLQLKDRLNRPIAVETTVNGVRDEHGKLCGFVSVHRRLEHRSPSLRSFGYSGNLFNNSSDIIVVVDSRGMVISWNPAAERVLKWRLCDVLDRPVREFLPPTERMKQIEAALAVGPTWRGEIAVKNRDGEEVLLDSDVTIVPDERGRPLGFLAISRDVTASRRAEEALRQSEARVRALLSAIPDTFLLVNRDGILLDYVSHGIFDFNFNREVTLGSRLSDLFPEFAEQAMVYTRLTLEKSEMQCFELQRNMDGELRDYEARLVASSPTEVLIIITDVTSHKNIERQLRESEQRFRNLVEQRQAGVYIIQDNVFQYVNTHLCEICGYDRDELTNGPLPWSAIDPESFTMVVDRLDRRMAGELIPPYSFRIHHKNGTPIDVEVFGARTIYRGRPAVIGTLVDITEHKRSDEALRESEERYRTVVNALTEGVIVHTVDGTILTANESAARILGVPVEQLQSVSAYGGLYATVRADGSPLPAHERAGAITVRTGTSCTGMVMGVTDSGGEPDVAKWLEVNSRPIFRRGESSPYAAVVSFIDITERKRTAEELHRQAFYDPLTGLANRALFLDRVDRALSHARRQNQQVALCFIDLDQFKDLNDALGHAVGDQFLEQVAQRLTRCVREGDTVARLGGDEFTLLLPAISGTADAERVAERVLEALRQPFQIGQRTLRTTASIGISLFPQDGLEVGELLRAADDAMYRVKAQGKNNFVCFSGP